MAHEHAKDGMPAGGNQEDKEQTEKDQSHPQKENTTLGHGATHLGVQNLPLHRPDSITGTPVYNGHSAL
jgi:hypothetical protein